MLGYHLLDEKSERYFTNVFHRLTALPIIDALLDAAIALRQQRKLSAGDALIAATALQFDLEVYTRNVSDFKWIPGLKVVNPMITE